MRCGQGAAKEEEEEERTNDSPGRRMKRKRKLSQPTRLRRRRRNGFHDSGWSAERVRRAGAGAGAGLGAGLRAEPDCWLAPAPPSSSRYPTISFCARCDTRGAGRRDSAASADGAQEAVDPQPRTEARKSRLTHGWISL